MPIFQCFCFIFINVVTLILREAVPKIQWFPLLVAIGVLTVASKAQSCRCHVHHSFNEFCLERRNGTMATLKFMAIKAIAIFKGGRVSGER
jgi:hypothetical protein